MRSVYRSEQGRSAIVEWCDARLVDARVPLDRRTIKTGLGDAHVTTMGEATSTVVFLPGTNFNIAAWLEIAELLAQEHRVISIDLPGQPGLSAPDRPRHAYDLYGIWLAETLKGLGVENCVLVGHSLGARIALAACVHLPGATSVIAIAPAGIARFRINTAFLLTSGRWFRNKDPDSSRALLTQMTERGFQSPDHLIDWMTLVARHTRTTLIPPPLPPSRLKEIEIPVRILVGEHDTFLPPRRLRWAVKKMRDVSVAWVENSGHLLPIEHPDVVVNAVRDAAG